jgi:uroporphyrin-III C-methyltransferase/precorrin-2 dehydrogenase/sirohydrochlorin ferrochelatase
MRYFPMFLDMSGRSVLLAGGGEQIAQKARLLRRTEARLVIMAADLSAELADLVARCKAEHVRSDLCEVTIAAADFAFIATDDEALDDKIAALARDAGIMVNMVDRPEQCDMITPALVDRDPVVVAIGTEGAAPIMAKAIKTSLEQALSPSLGPFIAMIRNHRQRVAETVAPADRLAFWNWAIKGTPWRRWLVGREAEASALIAGAAEAGRAPDQQAGGITMVELPAAPDLLSLRAVERLQNAATIFHPPGVDEGVLELARRDALRQPVNTCPRHELTGPDMPENIRQAAEDGAVVILVTPACKPLQGMDDIERIAAAHPA